MKIKTKHGTAPLWLDVFLAKTISWSNVLSVVTPVANVRQSKREKGGFRVLAKETGTSFHQVFKILLK